MKSTAVFLDRDGTIIEDAGYIDDPAKVKLLPGAAEALKRLGDSGYLLVIVSNQSGIARGLFDEKHLAEVHARVEQLLQQQGARIDGAYYCPYLDGPEATVEAYRRDSELRKPKPGMLLQAARELDIDLKRSWMIGNSTSDVEAGLRAGCRAILISENEPATVRKNDPRAFRVESIDEAADLILRENTSRPQPATAPASSQTAPAGGWATDLAPLTERLDRIHELLDRQQRQNRQHDFSVLRLFSALLQMFALVAALWGVMALLNDVTDAAAARLALAAFLQMAVLTLIAMDRLG